MDLYMFLLLPLFLVIGFFFGRFTMRNKKVAPKIDGTLELFDTDEALVMGLKIKTDNDVIKTQSTATFEIRTVALNT